MGLPLLGPRTWIHQAHLTGPVKLHFYPFQLHPSPLLVRCYLRKGANWGDDKRIIGWRFDVHELTGEYDGVNGDKVEGMMVGKAEVVRYTKGLTSCPEVIMAHDTCRFLIGFYLGSKRRFVFHALSYKTTHFSSHFSTFLRNTLSEHVRHICQRSVHSIPASFVLIRSHFGSVSNFFLFLRFFFIFHSLWKPFIFVPRHPFQTR